MPGTTVASTHMVTYQYTTSSISGCVPGTPRYFDNETDALDYYMDLKHNGDGIAGHDTDRASVKLWGAIGWNKLLPCAKPATS